MSSKFRLDNIINPLQVPHLDTFHTGWLYCALGGACVFLLLQMVLFENVHAFSCRSETRSLLKIPMRANPLLVFAVVAAQGVHIGAMFIPGLSDVLGVKPVSLESWGILLAIAASLLLVDEAAKYLHRRAAQRA